MKLRLFALLFGVYMLGASREQPWGDAHVVYETAQNLVDHFRLSVDLGGPTQFYATHKGKKFGVFPLGNVLAMAPGYALYKGLAKIPGAPAALLYRYSCHLPTSLLVAGVCVLFFSLARRQGATDRSAIGLALGLGLATILAVYARNPFSEALQTLVFTWVVERGMTLGERLSKRGALWAGVALGLLFNTKLVYALALPVLPIYVALRHRKQPGRLAAALVVMALPAALLGAFAVAHNYYKTGSLIDTGYQIPEGVFSGNAYAALHGYFLSPGKSVFLYSPPLVLGLLGLPTYLRKHRGPALFLLVLTGVVTLVNAKFRYWHADYCWGPRLLVPLTPVWLLPAASWIDEALERGRRAWRALAVGGLFGLGLYVQVLGSAFYWDHYIRIAIAVKDQTGAGGWYGEDLHHCHFIPQFSPLLGHAWLLRHRVLFDDDILADPPWKRVVPTKVNLTNEWAGARVDWWGLDWFAPGGAPYLGVLLLTSWAALVASSAVGLRRRIRV